uniref:Uncharacterized protein n=1 Tax=Pavo cristatus TaxID=9049 RepID=A0A8C9FZX0_PAVCR
MFCATRIVICGGRQYEPEFFPFSSLQGDRLFPFISPQHFTEFLDEFSQDVLGQLLNDPFLSEKNEVMEVELSPASPAPLIQAEHSYSLCGDSRPQSPLTHISTDDNFNEGNTAVIYLSLFACHDDGHLEGKKGNAEMVGGQDPTCLFWCVNAY